MELKKRCLTLFVAAIVLLSFTLPVMGGQGKININTATEKELCTLKRVGPQYAKRIIENRNKEGEFKTPGDITRVKGIGTKTFEENKDVIVVKDDN